MKRRLLLLSIAPFVIAIPATAAQGASRADLTPVTLGATAWQPSSEIRTYKLPTGPTGPLPQAIVVIASNPFVEAQGAPDTRRQVPADVVLSVSGRAFPKWTLTDKPSAFVINRDTIESNPGFKDGIIEISVKVTSAAESVPALLVGMPDPPELVGRAIDGPLGTIVDENSDPHVAAYIRALASEIGGNLNEARSEYVKLATCPNEKVARFARRGLRMMAYQLRKRRLSGDFNEHFDWGLYLQQTGLFGPAREEYEECRIIYPSDPTAQYRCGALHDRSGIRIMDVGDYMSRAGEAAGVANPIDWHVLVLITASRPDAAPNDPILFGPSITNPPDRLTGADITEVMNRWVLAQLSIWAATGGQLRLMTSFHQIREGDAEKLVEYECGVLGPPDSMIERRGWFDSVIVVRPRLASERDRPNRMVGGEFGPKGAAVSDLFHDASVDAYIEQWYRHFSWAVQRSEAGPALPIGSDMAACGHQPVPSLGFASREAMHYLVTPTMLRRAAVADVGRPGTHVHLWRVEGPYPVGGPRPANSNRDKHVLDPIPSGTPERSVVVDSEADFIDVAAVLPRAGWARAVATSWVFSPADQEVRMWIGQNDGAAVWVNGHCVHQGNSYSTGRYDDRNLVDTVASYAPLKHGWNEVRVVVESRPEPFDKGWGFSIRFCDWNNDPIPGLAYLCSRPSEGVVPVYQPPIAGSSYSWYSVKDDWHDVLPRLDEAQLQSITGVRDLKLSHSIDGPSGYFALASASRPESRAYRNPPAAWDPKVDGDVVLNNVIDWAREHCAVFEKGTGGTHSHLLFLRPEAIDAYLTLLNEPGLEASTGPIGGPEHRVLGYVAFPGGTAVNWLIVIESYLGDSSKLPIDEEDLLKPPLD